MSTNVTERLPEPKQKQRGILSPRSLLSQLAAELLGSVLAHGGFKF
jgi:hypothetical protein